jgi:hypothetical protein
MNLRQASLTKLDLITNLSDYCRLHKLQLWSNYAKFNDLAKKDNALIPTISITSHECFYLRFLSECFIDSDTPLNLIFARQTFKDKDSLQMIDKLI